MLGTGRSWAAHRLAAPLVSIPHLGGQGMALAAMFVASVPRAPHRAGFTAGRVNQRPEGAEEACQALCRLREAMGRPLKSAGVRAAVKAWHPVFGWAILGHASPCIAVQPLPGGLLMALLRCAALP